MKLLVLVSLITLSQVSFANASCKIFLNESGVVLDTGVLSKALFETNCSETKNQTEADYILAGIQKVTTLVPSNGFYYCDIDKDNFNWTLRDAKTNELLIRDRFKIVYASHCAQTTDSSGFRNRFERKFTRTIAKFLTKLSKS